MSVCLFMGTKSEYVCMQTHKNSVFTGNNNRNEERKKWSKKYF